MSGNPFEGQSLDNQTQGAFTGALGSTAGIAQGGALANTDLAPYFNPFTQSVVNSTMGEMNRQEADQANRIGSEAQAQNAFGGDRFAIQLAENNRNYDQQRANTLSTLYNTGFNTAVNNAQQDISNQLNAAGQLGNLANQGFNWGTDLYNQSTAAANSQQNSMQGLLDAIKGQYSGFTNQGINPGLQALLGVFSGLGGNMSSSHSSGDASGSSFGISGK